MAAGREGARRSNFWPNGDDRFWRVAAFVKRGVGTQWGPIYAGHCASDIASMAGFLTD